MQMTVKELLSTLWGLDIKIWLDGEQLCYKAPTGRLTASLRAQIVQRKAEIIRFLKATESGDEAVAPPIRPYPRDGYIPLSFSQQRLWFLDQLEGGTAVYNVFAALRILGPLNMPTLRRSFEAVVQRHEALRTNFMVVDQQPAQIIAPSMALRFPLIDLRALPTVEREECVVQLATAEVQRAFDLVHDPLLRINLLSVDINEHVLLLTMHHIISDGWSLGILIKEIGTLYAALARGMASSAALPELPIQYPDFAQWQREWLQGALLEAHLAYWRRQLGGAPALLDLPTDRPRPPVQTFRGRRHELIVSRSLTEALKTLGRQEESSLFMVLVAAFQSLLCRYTGQDELVVGTPIANRTHRQLEDLIGLFINTLALRLDLSGNPSFRTLLQQARAVTLDAYTHQDLPFEKLVDELHLARTLSHSPLFQVLFVLQNIPRAEAQLSELTFRPIDVDNQMVQFDLTLEFMETPVGLHGSLSYNTDLFDETTIARMALHFQTLLEGVLAHPDRTVLDLPLLTSVEERQLSASNHAFAAIARDTTIPALFAAQAARTPDAVALVFDGGQGSGVRGRGPGHSAFCILHSAF